MKLTSQSHPDLYFNVRSLLHLGTKMLFLRCADKCTLLNAGWPALDFLAVLAKPVYEVIVGMF